MLNLDYVNQTLAQLHLEREQVVKDAQSKLDRLDGAQNLLEQFRAELLKQAETKETLIKPKRRKR